MTVDVQQIHDEFSFGLLEPKALREFTKYAFENWQTPAPSYIVLLGDMSYDYRAVNPNNRPNFIPSIPYFTSQYGQAGSDNPVCCCCWNRCRPRFSIALKDKVYQNETCAVIREEKRLLESNFMKLGIEFLPSDANFYLVRSSKAREISNRLKARAILLGECSDIRGLDDTYLRVAVKSHKENRCAYQSTDKAHWKREIDSHAVQAMGKERQLRD